MRCGKSSYKKFNRMRLQIQLQPDAVTKSSLDTRCGDVYAYGMEKITVYRLEHAVTQTGPYQTEGTLASRMSEAHVDDPLRPTTGNDGLGWWIDWDDEESEAVFGCATLDGLLTWFDGWEKELHEAGYCISVYQSNTEKPFIRIGGKQVQFSYTDFDLMEQVPLVDTDADAV